MKESGLEFPASPRLRARLPVGFVTPHIIYELYRGSGTPRPFGGERSIVDRVSERCRLLPFDRAAARLAARMYVELKLEGRMIPERDLFIAASTIAWGDGIIMTGDVAHFGRLRVFGLLVLDPGGNPAWS